MATLEVVRGAIGMGHNVLAGVLGDLPVDLLDSVPAGAAIAPAGAILLHLVTAEDYLLNTSVGGRPTIFESEGWAAKLGCTAGPGIDAATAGPVKQHFAAFKDYMNAVFTASDAFLAGLSESDLAREINGPLGTSTVGLHIGGMVAYHTAGHTGEIAALKGVSGMKGLPF